MTKSIGPILLIAALLLLPLFVHDAYFLHVLILIGINVMVAVSMWLLGITGLLVGCAGGMRGDCQHPPERRSRQRLQRPHGMSSQSGKQSARLLGVKRPASGCRAWTSPPSG